MTTPTLAATARLDHAPACPALTFTSRRQSLGCRTHAVIVTCDTCGATATAVFDPLDADPEPEVLVRQRAARGGP